jgi:hypothetical protein
MATPFVLEPPLPQRTVISALCALASIVRPRTGPVNEPFATLQNELVITTA